MCVHCCPEGVRSRGDSLLFPEPAHYRMPEAHWPGLAQRSLTGARALPAMSKACQANLLPLDRITCWPFFN